MAEPPGGEVRRQGRAPAAGREKPRPDRTAGSWAASTPRGLRGLGSPRLVTGARRFPPASGVTSASATEQGLTWRPLFLTHPPHLGLAPGQLCQADGGPGGPGHLRLSSTRSTPTLAGQLVGGLRLVEGKAGWPLRWVVGRRFLPSRKVECEPDGKGILGTFMTENPTPYRYL